MKRIVSLFLSFLMVAMLLPFNAWAFELSETEAFPEESFEQEIILEEETETLLEEPGIMPEEPEIIEEEVFVEQETLGAAEILYSGNCGANGDNVKWSIDSNGVLRIYGTGPMKNYDYDDPTWTKSSYKSKYDSLVIENGVTTIGAYAFYECDNITGELVIPDSVTQIKDSAFSECSGFTGDLIIPDSVTSMGTSVFYECSGFNGKLVLPENITVIKNQTFYGCSGLIGSVEIPEGVTDIENSAFSNCGIDEYYFTGEALSYYTTPFDSDATLYYPEDSATWPGKITDGKWNGYTAIPYTPKGAIASGTCGANGDNLKWSINSKYVLTISGTGAMKNYSSSALPWKNYINDIKSIRLNSGITEIGKYAFYKFSALEGNIIIPDSVTKIGYDAFGHCKIANGKVVIGENVTEIADYAFYNTEMVGNMTIPENVETIGKNAFYKSTVNEYYFEGNVPTTIEAASASYPSFDKDADIFYYDVNKTGWNSVSGKWKGYRIVPTDENYLGSGICGDNLTWKVTSDGILTISGSGAMTDFGGESSVAWGNLKDVIKKINLPSGMPNIGEYAFYKFSALEGDVIIPDSVTKIGYDAFGHCKIANGKVVLTESVTEIADYAFYNTEMVGDMIIPCKNVTIGKWAFSGSTVNKYYFEGNAPTVFSASSGYPSFDKADDRLCYPTNNETWVVSNNAWNGYMAYSWTPKIDSGFCGKINSIDMEWFLGKDGVLAISGSGPMKDYSNEEGMAAPWSKYSDSIKAVVFASGITTIGDEAFYGCSALTGNVVIPKTVTSIGKSAFENCSGITEDIILPRALVSVGQDAFKNCGTNEYYFRGDAPKVEKANVTSSSFDTNDIIYYLSNNDTWVVLNEKWNGYSADTWELDIVDSGNCGVNGDNVKWKLDGEGTLIIYGTGAMKDYSSISSVGNGLPPWHSTYSLTGTSQVKAVIIEEGVTGVGSYAFYNSYSLEKVDFPESLTYIGSYAFHSCGNLKGTITFPKKLKTINNHAFDESMVEKVLFSGNAPTVYTSCFDVSDVTVFYPENDSSWVITNGKWEGYTAKAYDPEKPAVDSGSCGYSGSNVSWRIDFNGVLTISGNGPMEDYPQWNYSPWYDYRNEITSVVIEEGITYIGDYAFSNFNKADGDVIIPTSVTEIGEDAFFLWEETPHAYFVGDQPVVVEASSDAASFTEAVVYYPYDNPSWNIVNGYWNGYRAKPYSAGNIGAIAYGFCGAVGNEQNVKWVIDANGILTISGTGAMADYEEKHEGNIYYSISTAPWAEYEERITGLDIKNGVTTIGNYAFYLLECIDKDIVIPNSVTSVGNYAFYDCSGLTGLEIGTKVNVIGNYAFSGCENLSGNLIIPGNVKTIGNDAFSHCGFDGTLTIKNGVTKIGREAFYSCNGFTGDLVIPNSVTEIGYSAFLQTGFKGTLTLSENLTIIGSNTFCQCSFTGMLVLPKGLTEIKGMAFTGCDFTGDIYFPESLSTIGGLAFYGNSIENYYFDGNEPSIEEESLPSNATVYYYGHKNWTVEDGKWNGYTAIERGAIALESGYCGADADGKNLSWTLYSDGALTIEGTGAMANYSAENPAPWKEYAENISSLVLKEGITSIGDYAFHEFGFAVENIEIPSTVTEIGDYAFAGYIALTGALVIPENVVTIGNYAFSGCTGITSLIISNKTEVLGNHAFENCTGITSLNMQDGVEAIGDYTFYGCTGITYLDLSSETVGIGSYAFAGCTGLSGTLTIPEKVTVIGSYAFEGCSGFTGNLKIPNSVTTIGDYAFSSFGHQSYYRTLTFGTGLVSISDHAFDGAGFDGALVLPSNIKNVGDYAFNDCDFTGSLLISGVETIGDHAFDDCRFTGTVTFSENLRKIGKNAFRYSDITGYYFKGNVPEMTGYGYNASLSSYYAIHYPLRNETWEAVVEDERWNGYWAFAWVEGARACGYCGAEENGKNLWWILSNENVLTIYGEGAMEEHDSYIDYPWYKAKDDIERLVLSDEITVIGKGAFYGSYYPNLGGTLTLPSKLKSIGKSAFYNTGFTGDLIIPNSVEVIGNAAFKGCKGFDGKLVLSNKLKEIPYDAFYYCENFKGELNIPESVEVINAYAFYACAGFTGELVFPENLRIIDYFAFTACEGFTGKLVFPENLELIGAYAFQGCYGFERDVIIPAGVKEIGNYAFNNSPTDYYYFAGDKPEIDLDKFNGLKESYNFQFSNVDDRIFTPRNNSTWGEKQKLQWDPEVPGEYWGYCGEGLEWHLDTEGNLTISGVGRMEDYSGKNHGWEPFYSNIKTVTIEAGVEYIGKNAFIYCGTIDVYFKGNAPEVVAAEESDRSFNSQKATIYYPVLNESWEIIDGKWNGYNAEPWNNGVTAFGYCGADADGKNLMWVIDEGVLTISGTGEMENYTYVGSVDTSRVVAPWVEYSTEFDTLIIEDGVSSIGEFAFHRCENLKGDLTIPGSVKTIGRSAFFASGFDGKLVISEGVEKIEDTAFGQCSGFTGDLIIPDSVTRMMSSFKECSGFDGKLYIGKGLTTITYEAFWGCSGLTGSVVISENVDLIAGRAFSGCGINEFYFAGDAPQVTGATSTTPSFDATKDTLYYVANNTTWNSVENNLWNGYRALGSKLGDIDGSGVVDVEDAYTARLIAARLLVPTEWQMILGDVDGDGRITAIDCNYIRRFAVELISEFPVEKQ